MNVLGMGRAALRDAATRLSKEQAERYGHVPSVPGIEPAALGLITMHRTGHAVKGGAIPLGLFSCITPAGPNSVSEATRHHDNEE
jgi:hypothetical protein